MTKNAATNDQVTFDLMTLIVLQTFLMTNIVMPTSGDGIFLKEYAAKTFLLTNVEITTILITFDLMCFNQKTLEHDDTQYYYTRHYDNQHNDTQNYYTRHYDTRRTDTK